jgi:hypothetical protein
LKLTNESGPGVPEALPRTLRMLGDKVGAAKLDRLWIFPPLIRGRREWGLVTASAYTGWEDRRRLLSAPYVAERTGQGLSVVNDLEEQGEAPPDRLPRVMQGVVRRAGEELGEPREVVLEGSAEAFEELMKEFDPALLESNQP